MSLLALINERARLEYEGVSGVMLFSGDHTNMYAWTATLVSEWRNQPRNMKVPVRCTFPQEYPLLPPEVIMGRVVGDVVRPFYHPNVNNKTGIVRMRELEDDWPPHPTDPMAVVFAALVRLIDNPNYIYTENEQASAEFGFEKETYERKAAESVAMTELFCSPTA